MCDYEVKAEMLLPRGTLEEGDLEKGLRGIDLLGCGGIRMNRKLVAFRV